MREYLLNRLEITISSALLNRLAVGILQKWAVVLIQQEGSEVFQAIRKTMLSRLTKHSVLANSQTFNVVYQITKSVYGFN